VPVSDTSTPPTPGGPDGAPPKADAVPRASPAALWGLALLGLLVLCAVGLWAVQRRGPKRPDASLEAKALAARPPIPAAAAAYLEGMALMQQYRWAEAVPLFKQAGELDPAFALPSLRLTVALYFLGDSRDVISAMTEAVRLSTGAPDDIRLRVEPHYFWYQGQWEKCAQAARALRDSEPDNFEALYPSLLLTGCVPNPESLAVMARLRASGSPATRDARFDLMEARLAFAEREDRRAGEALDRAEAKATGRDNRFLEAAVLRQRSRLDARAGHYEVALHRLARAEQTYVEGGHAFEAARVAGERADVLESQGAFLEAAAEYERQLKLLEPFGATYAAVLATKGGAADYLAAGEPRAAAALLEKVKAYPQRILQNVEEVYTSVGRVALEQGDVAGAAAAVEPALKNLAKDASAAEPVLLAASVEREQDKLVAARERLEGATAVVAEDPVQVRIAELLLDSRDFAGAQKVLDGLSNEPVPKAQAARLRARSLLLASRAGEAKTAAVEAVEAARVTRQVPLLESAQLELAQAELATGDVALATALLTELETLAEARGWGRLLLEVRLAKLQALPKGAARSGAAKALESDARAAGFLRIARLAHGAQAH
jgi:tetratricopeptide (TPR) repeat protein